jgi:hypothetical protein
MAHTITGALPVGLAGQLQFVKESAYGTAGTLAGTAIPYLSCTLVPNIDIMESAGIKSSSRLKRADFRTVWNKGGSGTLEFELDRTGLERFLKAAMGGYVGAVVTGATIGHTFTMDTLTDDSLTIQAGVPTRLGVVEPFTFVGCVVTGWELSGAAGEYVKLSLDIDAQVSQQTTDINAAQFAVGAPFDWTMVNVKRAGSTLAGVRSFSLKGDNNLNVDRYLADGTGKKATPYEQAQRVYTLEIEAELDAIANTWTPILTDAANAFEIDIIGAVCEAARTYSLIVTLADCRLTGEPPALGSETDMIVPKLSFDVVTNAAPITIVQQNLTAALT